MSTNAAIQRAAVRRARIGKATIVALAALWSAEAFAASDSNKTIGPAWTTRAALIAVSKGRQAR